MECRSCREREFCFDAAVSAFRFQGPVRDLIHQVKYGREIQLVRQLAIWLRVALRDERLRCPRPDVWIPVPLHGTRERDRGFNQAEAIARLARRSNDPAVERCLKRVRITASQTEFDRRGRIWNLRGAFRLGDDVRIDGRHCLVIDDVFTTGSTLDECASVLLQAGAASVRCVTVARG